jgi:hypothetical protein
MKIGIVLLLLLILNPGVVNGSNFASEFNGDPSYTLEIETNNNQLNQGDNFIMNLYISGVGSVNYSQLRISIPPYIVKNSTVKFKSLLDESEKTIHYPIITTRLRDVWFKNYTNSFADYGGVYWTKNDTQEAPYTVSFTVPDNAPSGDQYIDLALYYKYNDKWYMDKQILPIHILYWYEKELMQYLAIIALIGSIIGSLTGIYKFINKKD